MRAALAASTAHVLQERATLLPRQHMSRRREWLRLLSEVRHLLYEVGQVDVQLLQLTEAGLTLRGFQCKTGYQPGVADVVEDRDRRVLP